MDDQTPKTIIRLEDSEANFLITCLEKYMALQTEGAFIREIAKLVETIDEQI